MINMLGEETKAADLPEAFDFAPPLVFDAIVEFHRDRRVVLLALDVLSRLCKRDRNAEALAKPLFQLTAGALPDKFSAVPIDIVVRAAACSSCSDSRCAWAP